MVVKDVWATKFMQATGTFESNKFVGVVQEASGIFEKTVPEVLANMSLKVNNDRYAVVGIIAMKVCPFLAMPNYKVIEGVVKTTEGFVTQQDAFAAADRPKEMFLYITDGYEITRIKDGRTGKIHPVVYALANPYKVLEPF
jgi:hypothetical protein